MEKETKLIKKETKPEIKQTSFKSLDAYTKYIVKKDKNYAYIADITTAIKLRNKGFEVKKLDNIYRVTP